MVVTRDPAIAGCANHEVARHQSRVFDRYVSEKNLVALRCSGSGYSTT